MLPPAHQTSSYEQKRKQRAPPAPRGRFEFRSEHLPSKLVGIVPSSASLLRPATKFRPALHLTAGSTHPLTLVPRPPGTSLPQTRSDDNPGESKWTAAALA